MSISCQQKCRANFLLNSGFTDKNGPHPAWTGSTESWMGGAVVGVSAPHQKTHLLENIPENYFWMLLPLNKFWWQNSSRHFQPYVHSSLTTTSQCSAETTGHKVAALPWWIQIPRWFGSRVQNQSWTGVWRVGTGTRILPTAIRWSSCLSGSE